MVAADAASCVAATAELSGAGWSVAEPGASVRGPVCRRYPVGGRRDAEAVVAAAVRGAAVLAELDDRPDADPDLPAVADDLVDDLAGLGPVIRLTAATTVALDADCWRLAHEIARGSTLEAAARLLHLSTRTANRRLTAARLALGAETRAHLVRVLASPQRVPPAVIDR